MTTEPLQFSVLTAPVAAIDRRALSQAWYSALYQQAAPARNAQLAAASEPPHHGARTPLPLPCASDNARVSGQAPRRVERSVARTLAQGGVERRQIRCALARKIERALLRPHDAPKRATFRIRGVHGRVHVMLRAGERGLQLVAVCSRTARAQVGEALAQARYALAARGIRMDAQLRCEEAPC